MAALDLMIAGAQKSGTSSLLAWLGTHPRIVAQKRPEMTWFTDTDSSAGPFPDEFYFDQGPSGPLSGVTDGARLRLGKLAGLMYSERGVDRLMAHSPRVTVIVVLRDPIERAYASFWFARRRGREPIPDFDQAVGAALAGIEGDAAWKEAGSRYLDWGCYAPHVERLHDRMGRASVHVVILEELIADGPTVISPVLDAFGLDAEALGSGLPRENSGGSARFDALTRARRSSSVATAARRLLPRGARGALLNGYRRLNERAGDSPPMSPDTRHRLETAFAGPNHRLQDLLGRPIEAWSGRR